jgi:hypothetical protein
MLTTLKVTRKIDIHRTCHPVTAFLKGLILSFFSSYSTSASGGSGLRVTVMLMLLHWAFRKSLKCAKLFDMAEYTQVS